MADDLNRVGHPRDCRCSYCGDPDGSRADAARAFDEKDARITEMQAEIARLREALERIANMHDVGVYAGARRPCTNIARAALSSPKE
jgi:hypothetical protein